MQILRTQMSSATLSAWIEIIIEGCTFHIYEHSYGEKYKL